MVKIDEKSHIELPSTSERVTSAIGAMIIAFLIIQVVGLFIIPGIGFIGLYPILWFGKQYSMLAFISVIISALVAICGLYGWFHGKKFQDRMMEYLTWFRM